MKSIIVSSLPQSGSHRGLVTFGKIPGPGFTRVATLSAFVLMMSKFPRSPALLPDPCKRAVLADFAMCR